MGPEGVACSRLQLQTPGGLQTPLSEPDKDEASAVLRGRIINKTPGVAPTRLSATDTP